MDVPRLCVVGSSNIDLISKIPRLPKLGETLVGHSFHLGYGGKGANQAVMAARLGARVAMVTKVGRDVFGDGTIANYRAQGVDATFVLVDPSRFSGVAPIFVDDEGRNVVVIVPGANLGLSPDDVRAARGVITGAQAVLCQLEVPVGTTLEAFRLARDSGAMTILNPAPAASLPEELLRLTDLCIPNETEAELLTGVPVGRWEDAAAAGRALVGRGPRTVIVTLGREGALLMDGGRVLHIPGFAVDAVDSTGAGDAFVGSLAVFLAEGAAMADAVRRANAVAALSVTKVGTQVSFPTREEVGAFLGDNPEAGIRRR